MLVLAAETSTLLGSVVLLGDDGTMGEIRFQQVGQGHSEMLLFMVDRLLGLADKKISDVELLVVSAGPGSFTGVRIGVVTFRTLAWINEIPLLSVSSLEAMAASFGLETGVMVPLLDAHKKEVYTAVFRGSGGKLERLTEDCVLSPARVIQQLRDLSGEPLVLFGPGLRRYRESFDVFGRNVLKVSGLTASAVGVGRLGMERFERGERSHRAAVVPNYVRKSEAELNWLSRTSVALAMEKES